ncbi:MAG: helix-turn-helix domain-containing protein [Propionibacterium sp.]|nr:helix-turn-helix domain-containing protein [Propionibacterium sp.]
MSPEALSARPNGLGRTRAEVLDLLEDSTQGLTVNEVAAALGLHKNSARFHLAALVEAGHARRTRSSASVHGRPPLEYHATNEAPSVTIGHLLELTQLLLCELAATSAKPFKLAEQAGRRWGESLAERNIAAEELQRDTAPSQSLDEISRGLAKQGFGLSVQDSVLSFMRCPFRATIPPEQLPLVCAIHQGLLEGFVRVIDPDLTVGQLSIGNRDCCVTIARKTQRSPSQDSSAIST